MICDFAGCRKPIDPNGARKDAGYKFDECGHLVHKSCASAHIEDLVRNKGESLFDMTCPGPECDKELEMGSLRAILGEALYEELNN